MNRRDCFALPLILAGCGGSEMEYEIQPSPKRTHESVASEVGSYKGIRFPSTQVPSPDVNTLDDYEEGTWTPTLGGTATYNSNTGTYTKIGRIVHIQGEINVNVIGTGSTTQISGLPFTNSATARAAVPVSFFTGIATSVVFLTGRITLGEDFIRFVSMTAAGTASVQTNAIFASGCQVIFSGTYHI